MHTRSLRSRLLALSLGINCCFLAMPARSQSLDDFAEQIDLEQSEGLLQSAFQEKGASTCGVTASLSAARTEFVQTLLQTAEAAIEQEENPDYRADTFYQIGKSYACMSDYDQAYAALKKSIALEPDSFSTYYELERAVKTAEVYGTLMGDVAQMNAVLAQVIALIDIDPESGEGTRYDALNESAYLYARHKQYQPLRALLDSTENLYVREQMMISAAAPLLDHQGDRTVIRQLFSEYDLTTLATEAPERRSFTGSATVTTFATETNDVETNSTEPTDPLSNYYYQLNDAAEIEELAASESIDTFIAQQNTVIESIQEPLIQVIAYNLLGEVLSFQGHPEAALPILQASQQQFERNVNETSLATLEDTWMTEAAYRERVQRAIVVALIRAGDFEQAQTVLKSESPALTDDVGIGPANQLLLLVTAVESPHFSLPDTQRRVLLSEAQALALQLEDNVQKFYSLIHIAEVHVESGDVAIARQLVPVVNSVFTAAQQSLMPHDYASLLISVGEYEQAIDLAEARAEDSDLPSLLPSYFVSIDEYDRAEELFEALPTIEDRTHALRFVTAAYYQQNRADLADALAVRVLDEIESDAYDAEVAEDLGPNYPEVVQTRFTERARIYAAERALSAYKVSSHPFTFHGIAPEILKPAAVELVQTIDSDLLRRETIVELFSTQQAITLLEQDGALSVSDSLRLSLVLDSVENGEFGQAAETASEVRSPYVQAQTLAYIALRYISADGSSVAGDR